MEERLQKYLANNGIAARRKCEEYILDGKVKVNGKIVTTLGTKINPETDKVEFNGKEVKKIEKKVYVLLNKPIGYVTTAKDQFDRPTVLDLVKIKEKVLPVGRLDMYTSGALLLTNDGEFINRVTHPKNEIEKTYTVTVKGIVNQEDVKRLEEGVEIEDYISAVKAEIDEMEEMSGFKLTNKMKKDFKDYMFKFDKDGMTEAQKASKDPKRRLKLAFLDFVDYNKKDFEIKAKTELANEYTKKNSRFTSKQAKTKGANIRKEGDQPDEGLKPGFLDFWSTPIS